MSSADTATMTDMSDPLSAPSPAAWCSHLSKRFGRQQAVRSVSFDVGRGEIVGLLGANGAGKTTVIKMLLGLVRPDDGDVMLLGRPGSDPASRARIGYLPELFRYQPWLTASEVLDLHARLCGRRPSEPRRRELLGEVGLADRAGDRVGGFSKGMQQRLGLAVALVGDPELVILDEPTSALDPLGRADVRDLVLSLRERGVAVLLNSHLIGEVERVCDRVVILDHGDVAAEGTLAQLLGQRRVVLRLGEVSDEARARLSAVGQVTEDAGTYHVSLSGDAASLSRAANADDDALVAQLIADLAGLGVRIYSVEQSRVTLEDRLLGILRHTADADAGAAADDAAQRDAS
jgi:ABC-2 type transport system ATP-binding protein